MQRRKSRESQKHTTTANTNAQSDKIKPTANKQKNQTAYDGDYNNKDKTITVVEY